MEGYQRVDELGLIGEHIRGLRPQPWEDVSKRFSPL